MARKSRDGKAPTQYTPVDIVSVPAPKEECERHLRDFITRFIRRDRQSRWTHCLLENPAKAAGHLHRFAADNEVCYCIELQGAGSFPESLGKVYGSERGLYFDGVEPACKVTAAEAATKATEQFRDALLSFGPGKQALFFHHEGSAWRCERI